MSSFVGFLCVTLCLVHQIVGGVVLSPGGNCVDSCRGMRDGHYQSCDGCGVYVSCSGGVKHDRPCPAGLVWDDNKKYCDYKSATCNGCTYAECQNGATCVVNRDDYICLCSPGYTGKDCHVNINECASVPCKNGGSCTDGINSYTCDCLPGFSGEHCQVNTDDCESLPCQNGASCIDGINSYSCGCLPGFSGDDCEINIDECASSPCGQGASCIDGVNEFTCLYDVTTTDELTTVPDAKAEEPTSKPESTPGLEPTLEPEPTL